MYFGSVKFFKHLIVTSILLVVVIFVGGLSFFVYNTASELLPTPAVNENLNDALAAGQNDAMIEDFLVVEPEVEIEIVKVNPFEGQVIAPYQDLYPDLYSPVEFPEEFKDATGIAYLTFDDGPSARTVEILDILKEYDIKATFFVVGDYLNTEAEREIVKRAYDEGHTIAAHTDSHVYKDIYSSVEAFLADMDAVCGKIYDITGEYPSVIRFPGGTVNSYNTLVYEDIAREMLRRGFLYYDWHSTTMDTAGVTDPYAIADHATRGSDGGPFIILGHDSEYKKPTVAAVPIIIEKLQAKGYTFDKLTNEVMPRAFGIVD